MNWRFAVRYSAWLRKIRQSLVFLANMLQYFRGIVFHQHKQKHTEKVLLGESDLCPKTNRKLQYLLNLLKRHSIMKNNG